MINNNYTNGNDEITPDPEKLMRMLHSVYHIERENSKTGSKTDKKMKEEICSIIEEEVKKCY